MRISSQRKLCPRAAHSVTLGEDRGRAAGGTPGRPQERKTKQTKAVAGIRVGTEPGSEEPAGTGQDG